MRSIKVSASALTTLRVFGTPGRVPELFFVAAIVADRNERRNITKGQKAMAYAKLFPVAKHGGDRKSGKSSSAAGLDQLGFSKQLLSQARAVYRYSPTLADEVRAQHSEPGHRV
jgi:hypothetical protein